MCHRELLSMMSFCTFYWEEQVHDPSMGGFRIKSFKESHEHMAACGVSGASTDCLRFLILACCYIAKIILLVNVINSKLIEHILPVGVLL